MRLSFYRVAFVVTAGLLLAACDKPARERSAAPATNAPAVAPQPRPQFTRLLGRWERPDGGYVLELSSVEVSGQFAAAYFNPNPIRVERALALSEKDVTKVLIVLRDEGYPGCTYQLTYDDKADQLYGTYYQATQQQTYDVAFARLKVATP
jgi:hypothetical protein